MCNTWLDLESLARIWTDEIMPKNLPRHGLHIEQHINSDQCNASTCSVLLQNMSSSAFQKPARY